MLYRFYVGQGKALASHRQAQWVYEADFWAATKFDGFTRFDAEGGWYGDFGYEREPAIVWEVFSGEDIPESAIRGFKSYLRELFDQQSVLCLKLAAEEV